MATLAEVNAHFEEQANACDSMGSPFTARVCRALARTLDGATATGGRVTAWPGDPRADALSLRLCGALNGLVLAGTDAALASVYPPHEVDDAELTAALVSAIPRHDAALVAGLTHAPQTNEIARSGVLLPGLLAVARATGLPLSITEIGSSAGLNLLLDRFNYRYGEQSWGDESSPVRLEPELHGAVRGSPAWRAARSTAGWPSCAAMRRLLPDPSGCAGKAVGAGRWSSRTRACLPICRNWLSRRRAAIRWRRCCGRPRACATWRPGLRELGHRICHNVVGRSAARDGLQPAGQPQDPRRDQPSRPRRAVRLHQCAGESRRWRRASRRSRSTPRRRSWSAISRMAAASGARRVSPRRCGCTTS